MTRPSPRAGDYGAGLWLNRDSGGERVVLYPGQGPDSAFALVGHLGQYVIVSPEQQLTIVRLGKTDDALRQPLVEKIAAIAALYPSR
jgi:CubicO group peptidase (beta-lactamase class C family)